MKEILSILNPVHLPTVDEFVRMSIVDSHPGEFPSAVTLMQRFEELTRGKWVDGLPKMQDETGIDFSENAILKSWKPSLLTKEMFVCEVAKPKKPEEINFFEGVVRPEQDEYLIGCMTKDSYEQNYNSYLEQYTQAKEKVWFEGNNMIWGNAYSLTKNINRATVFDFIIELDRFNRTAKEPIKINWTENFVKELLK